MIRILSHLKIFELKKVSHLKFLTRDQFFEQKLKRYWMIRILSYLKITCKDFTEVNTWCRENGFNFSPKGKMAFETYF